PHQHALSGGVRLSVTDAARGHRRPLLDRALTGHRRIAMQKILTPRFWLAFALVAAGVVLRVAPHPWNFAPVGAIALFGGAHIQRRWLAVILPLMTMLIGDAFIGFHSLMPVIYATYALIAVLGMLLRERRDSVPAVGGAALLSATI